MVQSVHRSLLVVEGQPPMNTAAVPISPSSLQIVSSVAPKPPQPRRRQPCSKCQQLNCRNGNLCHNGCTPSPSDPVAFPTAVTRRPSVDGRREGAPHRPRANRALSLNADPSTSPTIPQKSRRPWNPRKTSDPSTSVPIPQPRRPPSRTGAPDHPGGPNLPHHNPYGRGRKTSGPPAVGPRPVQRRATSRSSAHEQEHTLRQSPPRPRPHCRDWLKGGCPRGSNCFFTHDPEAQAAEELRKVAEARAAKLAKDQAAKAEKRAAKAEKRAAKAKEWAVKAEERAAKLAEERAAQAAQEAAATVEDKVLPSTKVIFGAGVSIKNVLTGHETYRVLIKNLPLDAKKGELITLLTQPGFDPAKFTVYPPHAFLNDRSHLEAVVEFEDPEDGKKAVAGLDEIEFRTERLKLVVSPKQAGMGKYEDRNLHVLTITWPAPSDTAFASYSSLDEANTMKAQLEKKTFRGRKVRVGLAKKPSKLPEVYWNSATIYIGGLEPGVSSDSIQELCGTTSIRMATKNTRNYNLNDVVPCLQALVAETHPGDHQSLTWEPNLTPNEYGRVSVKISFPIWEHAKVIHDSLDQKPLPLCPEVIYSVSLPDPFHYTINVPYPQYKAQEKLFQSLVPAQNDRSATVHLRIFSTYPDRPARVELSGSDKKKVGKLKVRIEQLIAGEKLPQWDRVFYGAEGENFLTKVIGESRAYVRVDKYQSTLKVFGEPAAVEQAKAMIQEEVDRLASLQFEVSLKPRSVRFFVDGARGSTLLKQEVGEENVMVDVSSTPCKVVIRGGESARYLLNKLVEESLSGAIRSQHQLKDGEICPVCYDTIDQPYRLACGHAYCHGCIHHFLLTASDTKQFPLSCLADEGTCCLPIPIPVIQRFLVRAQFKRLLEASFLDYLGRNPDKFRYCTTPDCPELYSPESDSGNGVFQCRSCFVSVCVSCREGHDGFSCEEWKIHRDPETQEKLLEGWADGHEDVKKCPSCKILIEKNGGCNHMTCPKCAAHICWRCMGVFSQEYIYDHMELVHGGMLDDDEPGDVLLGW